MAFTEGSSSTVTNNTTRVAAVSAPDSNVRRVVKTITVYNADTAFATVILEYSRPVGSTNRVIYRQTLDTGETLIFNDVLVLEATDNTISVSLAASVATNQLQVTAHYADIA